MTRDSNKSHGKRTSSPDPHQTSNDLEAFVIGLAEPDDTERQAMAEIGRQPGATGLDPTGKLVTVL